MLVVTAHQPNFLPWCKLMAKIMAADVFVAYDTVQFTRREFQARQRLKTRKGAAEWLTVPVVSTGARQVLQDVVICEAEDWRSTHLGFFRAHYGQAPYFDEVFALIEDVYRLGCRMLVDHNLALIEAFCSYLGGGTRIVRAGTVPHAGDREQRVLDLVLHTGGRAHLTSTATTYEADWSWFERAGVPVFEQVFEHPVYRQQHGGGFIPNLGVPDLLFNEGKHAAALLTQAHRSVPCRSRADTPTDSRGGGHGAAPGIAPGPWPTPESTGLR